MGIDFSPRSRRLVHSLVALAAPFAATAALAQAPADDPYTPIPAGFDFPADSATLERFRATENVGEMRRHAWYLWAGVNQPAPGGGPAWETWYPAPFVFRPDGGVEAAEASRALNFEQPRQLQPQAGEDALEAPGESMLSAVLFNQEGLDHIRDNKLYLAATLTGVNDGWTASTPIANREILDFEPKAVVVKTAWKVVRQSGLTEMPIWDGEPMQPIEDGNPPSTWKRKVLVDPVRALIPPGETFNDQSVVSLQDFYHVKLDTPELVAAARGGAVLGDYAALVCMHVTTKEIDDWVWATFWWHDRPNNGLYAADRPDAVQGLWRNYLMDVAYDADTPREFDGSPNACMNPWLEARFELGVASNCMTCHQRSTWPGQPFLPVTRGELPADDPYFADKTTLDFLWSIGDRANE